MTLRLYITGHGEWSPKDGYIKVPKQCTFKAPIKFGKVMADCDVRTLVAGDWKRKHEMIVEQYKTIPNYTWRPLEAAERKKDLFAFEFYRKNKAKENPLCEAVIQKGIIPKRQPVVYQNVSARAAPKSHETLMEEYKPGFIHSGDSMILYPDEDNPSNASAIISCPKGTVMTLAEIFNKMDIIFKTGIKNYGHVDIIWACCQALTLTRVGTVDRIINQVDSAQGYMHFDDLITKKKLILEKNLKVEFKSRIKQGKSEDYINDKLEVGSSQNQQIKTVNNIKKMLIKNGLRI